MISLFLLTLSQCRQNSLLTTIHVKFSNARVYYEKLQIYFFKKKNVFLITIHESKLTI